MPDVVSHVDQHGMITWENLDKSCGSIDINDDNEPAPENVPIERKYNMNIFSKEWGHNGMCLRISQGHLNMLHNALTDPNFSPNVLWLVEHF